MLKSDKAKLEAARLAASKPYKIPQVSKKRAAAIADGSFKPKERKPLKSSFKAPIDCTYKKEAKRIRRSSKKREAQERLYSQITRPLFLTENLFCQRCNYAPATEIHHAAGRIGDLLNNIKYFKAVCRMCHIWIEENPKQAKIEGLSVSRLNI